MGKQGGGEKRPVRKGVVGRIPAKEVFSHQGLGKRNRGEAGSGRSRRNLKRSVRVFSKRGKRGPM